MLVSLLAVGAPAAAQLEFECEEPDVPNVAASYYIGLGDVYFGQQDYTNAIAAYTCGLEAFPNQAELYVGRGFAYSLQRSYELALADYERALEIAPTMVSAYNNRGVMYINQGNFGLAVTDFTLALSFAPENVQVLNNRGIAYAAEGRYELALEDLNLAIELDPEFVSAHAALGAVYSALAAISFQEYRQRAGEGLFVLPRRQPVDILGAVEPDGQIREFEVWLPFLTPSQ